MTKQATGATVTYSATNIADPDHWYVTVSARDDSKLVTQEPRRSTSIRSGSVRSPTIPRGARSSTAGCRRGFPQLEQLIGLPWPAGNRLVITETVTPYLYGYAGWYSSARQHDRDRRRARPAGGAARDLAHVVQRPAVRATAGSTKGLAQEYAARAVATIGRQARVAEAGEPARSRRGATRERGRTSTSQAQNSQARETFGYNASWYVIQQAHERDRRSRAMRRVSSPRRRRMRSRTVGHEQPGGRRRSSGSWKRFLDYLDETGGAQDGRRAVREVRRDAAGDPIAHAARRRTAAYAAPRRSRARVEGAARAAPGDDRLELLDRDDPDGQADRR